MKFAGFLRRIFKIYLRIRMFHYIKIRIVEYIILQIATPFLFHMRNFL